MARENDRETDKERQLRRWQQAQRHLISRDEELRRKQASKAAHAARKPTVRRRDFDADGEHEAFARMRPRPPGRSLPRDTTALPRGTVTAVYANGIAIDGVPARLGAALVVDTELRPVVGDEVAFEPTDGPPRAVAILPRRSRLARLDPGNANRELVLAANVDLALIVVAARNPPLRPGLVDRCIVAVQRGAIAAAVCANKVDLLDADGRRELADQLAPYAGMGVPVVACSAATSEGMHELRALAAGKTLVLLGHSGVGKSSLANALDPAGQRDVGAVREGAGHGRQTTTTASLRQLPDGTRVIDTPGVRTFGLQSVAADELRAAFPEFAPFATGCRFADCTHVHEPQCAVREAVAAGRLAAARHASWLRILTADA